MPSPDISFLGIYLRDTFTHVYKVLRVAEMLVRVKFGGTLSVHNWENEYL